MTIIPGKKKTKISMHWPNLIQMRVSNKGFFLKFPNQQRSCFLNYSILTKRSGIIHLERFLIQVKIKKGFLTYPENYSHHVTYTVFA